MQGGEGPLGAFPGGCVAPPLRGGALRPLWSIRGELVHGAIRCDVIDGEDTRLGHGPDGGAERRLARPAIGLVEPPHQRPVRALDTVPRPRPSPAEQQVELARERPAAQQGLEQVRSQACRKEPGHPLAPKGRSPPPPCGTSGRLLGDPSDGGSENRSSGRTTRPALRSSHHQAPGVKRLRQGPARPEPRPSKPRRSAEPSRSVLGPSAGAPSPPPTTR